MPNRRRCEWISNNKVLIGNGKKTHARNPNFDTDETKLLISLWGDPKIQKTLITTHKKSPVIEKLAQNMRENGYFRSPEEINTRIKNLKCLYNRIKKDLELGILTEPTWKHYSAMDEILNRPIFGRSALQERLRQQQLLREQQLQQLDASESDDDKNDEDEEENISEVFPEDLLNSDISHEDIKIEEPFIVPKEELIDVDEMEIPDDISDTDIMQDMSSTFKIHVPTTSGNSKETISATTNEQKIVPPLSPKSNIKISGQPFVVSTNTTSTTQSGKISLVPTNILLKQQQPKITFKPPHSILYTTKAPTTTTPATSFSMPIQTTANTGMPMKLLFVNRVQNRPGETPTTSLATTITTQSINQTQKINPSVTIPKVKLPDLVRKPNMNWKYSQKSPGFRTLLHQLVQIETQNLNLSRERLEMEKQRFEFEKTVGDKILNILTKFQVGNNNNTANDET